MSSSETSLEAEDFNLAYEHSPLSHHSDNSPLTDTPPNDINLTEINLSTVDVTHDVVTPEEQEDPPDQSDTHVQQPDPLGILSDAVQIADNLTAPEIRHHATTFPLSRVKTIMKTDPDTSLLQSDAVFIMGEAARLFLRRFSRDAQRITAGNKKKTVSRMDVDTCLTRYHEYEFLEEQLDW